MPLSDAELATLRHVSAAFASLSLAGSLFIIACFWALDKLRHWNMRLVFVLSVFDVLSDVGGLVASQVDSRPDPSRPACVFTAVYLTIFDLPPVLWTGCISYSLYYNIIKFKPNRTLSGHMKYYLGFVAASTAVAVLAAAAPGAWGEVEGQRLCWLRSPGLRVGLFYAPVWAVVVFNTTVNVLVTREYNRVFARAHVLSKQASSTKVHHLKLYPLALVLVWGAGSVLRVLELARGEDGAPWWLYCVHTALRQSQGLLNALVYGLDPLILSELRVRCAAAWRGGGSPRSPSHAARDAGGETLHAEMREFSASPSAELAAAHHGARPLNSLDLSNPPRLSADDPRATHSSSAAAMGAGGPWAGAARSAGGTISSMDSAGSGRDARGGGKSSPAPGGGGSPRAGRKRSLGHGRMPLRERTHDAASLRDIAMGSLSIGNPRPAADGDLSLLAGATPGAGATPHAADGDQRSTPYSPGVDGEQAALSPDGPEELLAGQGGSSPPRSPARGAGRARAPDSPGAQLLRMGSPTAAAAPAPAVASGLHSPPPGARRGGRTPPHASPPHPTISGSGKERRKAVKEKEQEKEKERGPVSESYVEVSLI